MVVEQQRQIESEREFPEGRDRGVEHAVEHRVPPQGSVSRYWKFSRPMKTPRLPIVVSVKASQTPRPSG